jgi:geranylgeranyl pyrophosphate synthase
LTIRDEIVDVFEKDEISNRAEKECLPLPIICAFQDESRKIRILKLLKDRISEDKIEKILDLSMDCKETRELIGEMKRMVKQESLKLASLQKGEETLKLLLESTIEDL